MSARDLKQHIWRFAALLTVVALLVTAVAGAVSAAPERPASPIKDGKNGDVISSAADGVEVTAERPWTAAEMAAAIPYPLPEVSADAIVAEIEKAAPAGAPGSLPGALPGGIPTKLSDDLSNLLGLTGGTSLTGYGYPPPYTRYEIFTAYTQYPYVTVGKLFFKQSGVSYVCSAAVVNRYVAWTAGHCVHKGNNSSTGWSTNVVFVPAYKDGAAPKGSWSAYQLFTTTPWYQLGNPNGLRGDLGAIVLRKNTAGQGIGNITGWLGFAWNWGYELHWNSLGYPAAAPFNGLRMHTCLASYAYQLGYGTVGPATRAIGCDMTGGTSGGPWIWKFGTGNYVNGNNSYRRTGYTHELASPHFTSAYALPVFNAASAVTPP